MEALKTTNSNNDNESEQEEVGEENDEGEEQEAQDETTTNYEHFHYTGQAKEETTYTMTHLSIDPSIREIERNIFERCKLSLRWANIPGTVAIIGESTFYGCEALLEVEFHEGLKEIRADAFRGCYSLATMELPQGLIHIGRSAFHDCKALQSVSVPPTVEEIGNAAFAVCWSLVTLHLHQGLKTIGDRAFFRCPSLQEVKLPEGLTTIGKYAFQKCESLATISFPSNLEEKSLSEDLRSIQDGAFVYCKSLVELYIPQGLSSVSDSTFWNCESLCSVWIPDSVETIGRNAFKMCYSLADIHLSKAGRLKLIRRGAFGYCRSLSAISLPSSLEEIENSAFEHCSGLMGIEIPVESRVIIARNAYIGCSSLVNVSIPSSLKVEDDTFSCYRNGSTSRLSDRYATLPVHQACYHSSVHTRDEIIQVLDAPNALVVWKDGYNMTPFHVLATSANPKLDILECLLDYYPLDMLYQQDMDHRTMFDYLLKNNCKAAFPLVQMILQKVIVEYRISKWILGTKLAFELSRQIQSVGRSSNIDGIHIKQKMVEDFFLNVGHYTRVETTSLMELALWKHRMKSAPNDNDKEDGENKSSFRESCRYQCGAQVVINSVVGYLWTGEEAQSSTALSFFPLYSEYPPERIL